MRRELMSPFPMRTWVLQRLVRVPDENVTEVLRRITLLASNDYVLKIVFSKFDFQGTQTLKESEHEADFKAELFSFVAF